MPYVTPRGFASAVGRSASVAATGIGPAIERGRTVRPARPTVARRTESLQGQWSTSTITSNRLEVTGELTPGGRFRGGMWMVRVTARIGALGFLDTDADLVVQGPDGLVNTVKGYFFISASSPDSTSVSANGLVPGAVSLQFSARFIAPHLLNEDFAGYAYLSLAARADRYG